MFSQTNSPSRASTHFKDLDGMRGVLACIVMLYHYGLNSLLSRVGLSSFGGEWGLSVDFFFLLSGFVMCRSFLKKDLRIRDYFAKRTLRLAPMYLLALILAVISDKFRATDLELAANFSMCQSLFAIRSINYPSWSIPLELFIPALGLLTLPIAARMKISSISAAVGMFIILGLALTLALANGHDFRLPRATVGLGCGMCLWILTLKSNFRRPPSSLPMAAFIGCIVLMAISRSIPWIVLLFYPCAAFAICGGYKESTFLSTYPVQVLGRCSYSIYLLHIPILALTSIFMHGKIDHNSIAKLSLAFVCLIASYVCYCYIEQPFMNFGRTAGKQTTIANREA